MIDIDNYTKAIAWLRRTLAELERDPTDPSAQLSVLQSFEVTYNLSESILRQACLALPEIEEAAHISTRELIWRAFEEGIVFSSRKQWMEYGLALESMREACMLSVIDNPREVLSRFADDLQSFASSLEKRLATNV